MSSPIDPKSPVPLFHQIAEAIRGRIEAGELGAGDALEPLRDAAERWGVNLHTVRHAYTALARDGLVETRGTRGTRVAARVAQDNGASVDQDSLRAFLERVSEEARKWFGLDRRALIEALNGRADQAPTVVWVVECSEWQCESHCRELCERFDVDARPWSLERDGEPGAGTVLATYFHYNDIRRRWADRLRDVRFITIGPDPAIAELVDAQSDRVIVHEVDEETALNVAADVALVLGRDVEVRCGTNTANLIDRLAGSSTLLVPPRIWTRLDDRLRRHPSVHEARYVFDRSELDGLAHELAWARRAEPQMKT